MPRRLDYPEMRDWLIDRDFSAVLELASRQRRTLSFLTALTYDRQALVAWRAIEALGLVAAQMAEEDPEYVRVHLRRMLWLLSDESGGVGWRAPESIGEILHHRSELFQAYVPILFSCLDMEPEDAVRFRPGALWGLGRLAQARPAWVRPEGDRLVPCLADPDPHVRGLALWALSQAGYLPPQSLLEQLARDRARLQIYRDGQLESTTVAQLAVFNTV